MGTLAGVDPSTTRLGIVILRDGELIHHEAFVPVVGGVSLNPAGIRAEKLRQIEDKMTAFFAEWRPDGVALETSETFQRDLRDGFRSLDAMSQSRAVVMVAAQRAGVKIYPMDTTHARSLVLGYGNMKKEMVPHFLGLKGLPVPTMPRGLRDQSEVPDPDICDALVAAIAVEAEEFAKSLIGRAQRA